MKLVASFFYGILTTLVILITTIRYTHYSFIDDWTASQLKYGDYSIYWYWIVLVIYTMWLVFTIESILSIFKHNKDENMSKTMEQLSKTNR